MKLPVFIAGNVHIGAASTEAEAAAVYVADYAEPITADAVKVSRRARAALDAGRPEIEAAEADCPGFRDAWIVTL